jgi:hypothetical protein
MRDIYLSEFTAFLLRGKLFFDSMNGKSDKKRHWCDKLSFLIRPIVWIFLFGFQRKQSGRNPKTEENNIREETSVNPGKRLSH